MICEIGRLSDILQQRLLEVLQDKELIRLGGVRPRSADFRLIATASDDLHKRVARGEFREELYYAVDAFPVHVPPLRDRKQDITEMVIYFVEIFSKELGREVPEIRDDVFIHLSAFHWFGNILELENAVKRVLIAQESGSPIRPGDFSFLEKEAELVSAQDGTDYSEALDILADALVEGSLDWEGVREKLSASVVEKCGGDRVRASRTGIPGLDGRK